MNVILRADASTREGTGHAMRCLALAQALVDAGHGAVLASAAMPPAIGHRFTLEGVEIVAIDAKTPGDDGDAQETWGLAMARRAEWVVVDGYAFDASFLTALRGPWQRMLIDDLGRRAPVVDAVVNPNVYASRRLYPGAARHCRLLLGSRFALLRREFWNAPPQPASRREVRRVLVTLGGGDPDKVTIRVLRALADHGRWELRVVVGVGHPDPHSIEAAGGRRVEILRDVPSLAPLLRDADLVVGAGGTSAMEFAHAGVPAMLIELAPNQRAVIRSLRRAGVAVSIGVPDGAMEGRLRRAVLRLASDAATRTAMSAAGRRLVDGQGARRVLEGMCESVLHLRPATIDDGELMFDWVNDADVRAASFQTRPIGWDEHVAWLRDKLADARARIWLGEVGGKPAGIVRFQLRGKRATISVSVGAEWRGTGIGTRLIGAGSWRLLAEGRVASIDAWVRPDNATSLRAFEACGYRRRTSRALPRGVPADAVLMTLVATNRG